MRPPLVGRARRPGPHLPLIVIHRRASVKTFDPNYVSPRGFPLAASWPNLLVRGKPFGASRPASARLPRQSASSLSVNEKARPAVSVHDRPSAASKVLRSDSPPAL